MTADKQSGRTCPRCLSNRVHRSHSRGPEVVVRLFGLGFYRCHACHYRFLRYRGCTQRQQRLVLLFAGAVVLLLLVWYGIIFLGRDPAP